jgi:hypothetical protein
MSAPVDRAPGDVVAPPPVVYDPDRSTVPYTVAEIDEVLATTAPSPAPAPGEHVFYRHEGFGDVTDALVLQVVDDGQGDDPGSWPSLVLDTAYGRVVTREARVRGSAGWLPSSWAGGG